MTTPTLLPVRFKVPLVNPSPGGLYSVTNWTEEDGAERWLASGVEFRPVNYSGEAQFGIWNVPWCGDPGVNVKAGERPDEFPDPFVPLVVWAWDHAYCGDVTSESQTEVRERVAQVMRLQEQAAVETAFATRALADAGTPATAADIVGAVAFLDEELAKTNVVGLIHARPMWAASVVQAQLVVRSGGVFTTPLGNRLVFGSGYIDPLGDTLIATSAVFGWRGAVRIQDALEPQTNEYVALAEREVVVGYEALVAAVTVS